MVVFTDRVFNAARADSVTAELQAVYRAVVGDQSASGYVNDVGAYPASLFDLVRDPGAAGWRGPYLRDPRVTDEMLLDPWNQPFEFWVSNGGAGADRLAIISRGPDGLSTNIAADPNVSTNFTGIEPSEAAYFSSDLKNADNEVFPLLDPSRADTLDVDPEGFLNVTLKNFDSNPLVDAFVPACPNLFNVTVSNTIRGTDDVPATPYSPGFEVTLLPGSYRVLVSSVLFPTPLINDQIVISPGVRLRRNYNVAGLDSSGTQTFTLTVTNQDPVNTITVASFATDLGTVAPNGGVSTFSVGGCSTVNLKIVTGGGGGGGGGDDEDSDSDSDEDSDSDSDSDSDDYSDFGGGYGQRGGGGGDDEDSDSDSDEDSDSDSDEDSDSDSDNGGPGDPGDVQIIATFTMPFSDFSKVVDGAAATITVNNSLAVTIQVFADGLFVGDITTGKSKAFSSDLVAGNVITVKRVDTGALVGSVTLTSGSQTLNVP